MELIMDKLRLKLLIIMVALLALGTIHITLWEVYISDQSVARAGRENSGISQPDVTATYGAEQFFLQLTAIAKQP